MIRDELAKDEKMIMQEIREAKDSGIKTWSMMNKLRGIEKTEKEILFYSENDKCIDEDQLPKEIMKYWEGIFRKGENNISEWEGEKRGRHEEGKKGKQPGPDRLKGEIYIGLKKSEKLVHNIRINTKIHSIY